MNNPTIELWDVEKLIPYEANAKKHSPQQVADLANLIKKAGWTQPIVVDKDGVIIAGHGRRLAALKLKEEGRLPKGLVPVIVRRDLSKAEADALRLADNRVTSTDYDQALIQEELQRLAQELTGDLQIIDLGFDEKELDFALSDLGEIDDSYFVDDVAEAVEQQKRENEKAIEATDDIAAPIGDALGFKRVTIAQSRQIRELMSAAESRTGKKGVDLLIAALSAV